MYLAAAAALSPPGYEISITEVECTHTVERKKHASTS
jgi:hypothetical protein